MCEAVMYNVLFQEGHFEACYEFGSRLRAKLHLIVVRHVFDRGSGVTLRFVDNAEFYQLVTAFCPSFELRKDDCFNNSGLSAAKSGSTNAAAEISSQVLKSATKNMLNFLVPGRAATYRYVYV